MRIFFQVAAVATVLCCCHGRVLDRPEDDELFITGEDGKSYLEGDILVSDSDKAKIYEMYGINNPRALTVNLKSASTKTNEYWNYRFGKLFIVPYEFDSSLTANLKQLINEAIEIYKEKTCIRFLPRSTHENFILIKKGQYYSSSEIGMKGGLQPMEIKHDVTEVGVVLHEMMHALGFYHEHSRPDRDDYVKILWNNIRAPTDTLKWNFYMQKNSKTNGTPYDYESVMHYRLDKFAKPGTNTIQVLRPQQAKNIGQRTKLSKFDIKEINTLYHCQTCHNRGDNMVCIFMKRNNLCRWMQSNCQKTCGFC